MSRGVIDISEEGVLRRAQLNFTGSITVPDVIENIFEFLSLSDILNFSATSNAHRQLIHTSERESVKKVAEILVSVRKLQSCARDYNKHFFLFGIMLPVVLTGHDHDTLYFPIKQRNQIKNYKITKEWFILIYGPFAFALSCYTYFIVRREIAAFSMFFAYLFVVSGVFLVPKDTKQGLAFRKRGNEMYKFYKHHEKKIRDFKSNNTLLQNPKRTIVTFQTI